MASRVELWIENLDDERNGAALYEGLAEIDRDETRRASFRALAEGERRHAAIWERKLTGAGEAVPPERAAPRTRLLLWMARRLGTNAVLPLIMEAEVVDGDK